MTGKNGENDEPLDLHLLQREMEPPTDLEDRIVSELRYRRLFAFRFQRRSIARLVMGIAACLVFFTGGVFCQRYVTNQDLDNQPTMSDSTFVLFLLEDSKYLSPKNDQQMQERIELYRNWATDLRKRGVPISGTKLQDDKNLIGTGLLDDKQAAVSGYFLIDAQNPEEAVEIARKCPHLLYGGTIEVRRVHPV